jgi:hypothetical protein
MPSHNGIPKNCFQIPMPTRMVFKKSEFKIFKNIHIGCQNVRKRVSVGPVRQGIHIGEYRLRIGCQ